MKNVKELRILYFGTPVFSASLLNYLIEAGYHLCGVVTKADSQVGRHQTLTQSPVKKVALAHDIPVFSPVKLKHDYQSILETKPDLILTFAYGQILPVAVLQAAKFALNFHGSLLPKYRGASPIQMALMNGDLETGVTLMEMVEAMDAGVMYAKRSFPLTSDDDFQTVSEKMVVSSIELINEELEDIISGKNKGIGQDEALVSFAPILKAADELVDIQTVTTRALLGKIRAFSPATGIKFLYEGNPLMVFKAAYLNDKVNMKVGTIFVSEKTLVLQVIDGQISLILLQKAGKNKVEALSFINGEKHKLPSELVTKERHG